MRDHEGNDEDSLMPHRLVTKNSYSKKKRIIKWRPGKGNASWANKLIPLVRNDIFNCLNLLELLWGILIGVKFIVFLQKLWITNLVCIHVELYEPAGVLRTRTLLRSDWGKLGWTLVIYSGQAACVASISYSSSARGPRERREEGVPDRGQWRHVSIGRWQRERRKLSRHQTWGGESPGLCGERLDIGALMRMSWSSRLYWSSSDFIHKCFYIFYYTTSIV